MAFDQNSHHLYSSSAGEKDISIDNQIKVIGSIEPEVCIKMPRNLGENCEQNFPQLQLATLWWEFLILMMVFQKLLNWK